MVGIPLSRHLERVPPWETTGKYLWQTGTGQRDVPNAGRFVGGVLYGERDKQPDNVPTLIADAISGGSR